MVWMLVGSGVVFGGVFGFKWFGGKMMNAYMDNMPIPPAVITAAAAESRAWMTAYGKGQIEARVARGMSYAEATVEVDLLSVEEALSDRAGNPDLKPELATGIDLSLEHWLPTGGIVSGSAFVRDIQGVIRNQVLLETVSWDSAQRWVSRPRNMSSARTMGLEFEIKARLDELWDNIPPELQLMLVRFNIAAFTSSVRGIPGSNNRLDQQPRGSLNFGVDHRWKALGQNFGSGFNINLVPATTVQQTETRRRHETARKQFDAYLAWSSGSVRDGINWRLSLANLFPNDAEASSEGTSIHSLTDHELLTDSWSRNKTFRVVNLRADMRF
jgi:iron complex outermembrane receptor protein